MVYLEKKFFKMADQAMEISRPCVQRVVEQLTVVVSIKSSQLVRDCEKSIEVKEPKQ